MIGKLLDHTVAALNRGALRLIDLAPMSVLTVSADNGTEFHGYKDLEAATGALFYFPARYLEKSAIIILPPDLTLIRRTRPYPSNLMVSTESA